MTTTDQRPAHSGARTTAVTPDDPRSVEPLVAPVARRAVEIIRDMRPENSLARLVTPEVGQHLARRAALTRRLRASTGYAPPRQLMVTGVRLCVVNEHTVEASCVLREPDRARFLAMRWELRHTGWRVTVLEIG
ncbi:MAG: Rv3235 family protein [Brachybacterium sp.]|nr:Rv3235 family protein [Brachybacterium sp.]MDN5898623.1 Rv3235 family protein [Brachybacterium sp.]